MSKLPFVGLLIVPANFGTQRLGESLGNVVLIPVLLVGLAAGLVIGRWWAIWLAASWFLVGAVIPTGTEDTRGGLIFLVGFFGMILQAPAIALGVVIRRWAMSRTSAHAGRAEYCPCN